jgi:hypothetical protein
MNTNAAAFVTFAGLLLALGGAGGIEHSIDNEGLLGSVLLAILGLLAMYAGVLGLNNSSYYDRG